MTDTSKSRSQPLHLLMFYVRPTPQMSKADRRRFFSAMRRALHAADYEMSHSRGLCLVVPSGRQPPRTCRDEVLGWLLDRAETRDVSVFKPVLITDLITGKVMLVDEAGAALVPKMNAAVAAFLLRATSGALLLTVMRLQQQEPDLHPHHAWRHGPASGVVHDRRRARSRASDRWSPASIAQALATSLGRKSI